MHMKNFYLLAAVAVHIEILASGVEFQGTLRHRVTITIAPSHSAVLEDDSVKKTIVAAYS